MDPKAIELVTRSYGRCVMNKNFFDAFYATFLKSSEKLPPYFVKTDFTKQKELLRAGINFAIMFAKDPETPFVKSKIDGLGHSHSKAKLNIPPTLYPLWLDSLLKTVKTHDPEFSPEVEAGWRAVIAPTIHAMTSKH